MTEDLNRPAAPFAADAGAAFSPLRRAREEAKLSLADLAAVLKVPEERLQALEEGRYQVLPNLTFARALTCSVCRVLKLDPAPMLQSLPQQTEVQLGSMVPLEKAHLEVPSHRMGGSGGVLTVLHWRSPWLWAVVVLVLAAALWWWLPQREVVAVTTPAPSLALKAPETDSSASAVPPVGVAAPLGSASVVQDLPTAGSPAVALGGVAQQPTEVIASPSGPQVTPGALLPPVLRLHANATTWVRLKAVDGGKVLQERTLQPGETLDYEGPMPVQVILGRPGGIDVLVRGQAMDMSVYPAQKAARFEVK